MTNTGIHSDRHRTKKYTPAGLKRMWCANCCRQKACEQWMLSPCAANYKVGHWIPVCLDCDFVMNEHALNLLGYQPQHIRNMMLEYKAKKLMEHFGSNP